MSSVKSPVKYLIFSVILIAIDQVTKLLVHKYMDPGFSGQIVLLGDWLKLHYVLNPGMAFGMQLGHENGKLFLTLFRLFAMVGIGYYLVHMAKRGASSGFLWAMAMIFAGAVGNVIDSTFYGVFLEGNATYGASTPWFHGQVIDMIFVDFWEGFIPEWVPVWGGQYYSTPIFNVADSCIFVGVCIILIFQGHFFTPVEQEGAEEDKGSVSEGSEDKAVLADRVVGGQEVIAEDREGESADVKAEVETALPEHETAIAAEGLSKDDTNVFPASDESSGDDENGGTSEKRAPSDDSDNRG